MARNRNTARKGKKKSTNITVAKSSSGREMNGLSSSSVAHVVDAAAQNDDLNEKSAFEILRMNEANVDAEKSPTKKTKDEKMDRPLASDKRRKHRANDGINADHIPIRTTSQILAAKEHKESDKPQETNKEPESGGGESTAEKAAAAAVAEQQPVKETTNGELKKSKKKKKKAKKGLKRKASASGAAASDISLGSKKKKRSAMSDESDEDENVFAQILKTSSKITAQTTTAKKLLRKKVVSGGKIIEIESKDSDVDNNSEDAIVLDSNIASADIEVESDESDQSVLEISGSEDEDEAVQESEKKIKRKMAIRNEREDFKAEDYRVIIKEEQPSKMQQKIIDFKELPFSKNENSVQNAIDAWQWIIAPMKVDRFFQEIFESKALIVARKNPNYYGNLYSTKRFVEILQENYLEYGANVNVAVYKDGERFTPNGIGKVYADEIRAQINAGHSVQFVNPQSYCNSVWHLCETLQEMFGSFVGTNTYLTPAGTAGFAPHWDEIDAFLLQLEGRKHWKVFAPIDDDDSLPRDSSGPENFSDEDMSGRTPIFDGWIEQGDLLYIPRGFIHQGYTGDSTHSLHLTVSVCRRVAFVDLWEKFMPVALAALTNNDVTMRRSLPIRYMEMGGVLPSNYPLQNKFSNEINDVLKNHMKSLHEVVSEGYESALDIMARDYLKSALPPLLTKEERELSANGAKDFNILNKQQTKFTTKTKIKFIRKHAQRLIFENEERCFVVHRMANSRVYEERPEVSFDLDIKLSDGFISLLDAYPQWINVSQLDCSDDTQRIQLATILYGNGLLMAKF